MSFGYSMHRAELERGERSELQPAPLPKLPRIAITAPTLLADVRSTISVNRIMIVTAHAFDLEKTKILSRSKKFPIAHARQAAMHLVRKITTHSLPRIGRFLGVDHTTVMHGIRRTEMRLQSDARFSVRYARAANNIGHEAFLRTLGPVALMQYRDAMEVIAIEATNGPI